MHIGIDITLLCLERPTGVPLIARYLTEALVREFPQDTFILFACVPRKSAPLITHLPVMKLPNVRLKLISLPQRIFGWLLPLWQRCQWPPVELFMGRLDVFHNFDWFALPSNASATATMYDMTPLTHPEWHTASNITVFTKRLQLVIKKYAHIFAISRHTKNELQHLFPQLNTNVSVMYPDAVVSTKTSKKQTIESGYFFVVGTIEPRKNLVRTLKAYLELVSLRNDIPSLVVAGSIGWDEEASTLLKSSNHIIPIGYISNEELSGWYHHALALVYPSLAEGFGIPIVEAMRSGTMVITSNVTSMPEVGGEAAWYCDPLSIDSIKQAMIQVVSASPLERKRRISLGLKQASSFSYIQSAHQMRAVWARLPKERR